MPSASETVDRLLDVIERDILPLTRTGVAAGNKVFGAAVLRREDLDLVVATTNRETAGALWHGEMAALSDYFGLARRPDPTECALLSTHEPCPMCASAAAWCGMQRVWYLFSYEDTRDEFAIPHDQDMLHELFGAERLNHRNRYYDCWPIQQLGEQLSDPAERLARIAALREEYRSLSAAYQGSKGSSGIPLP